MAEKKPSPPNGDDSSLKRHSLQTQVSSDDPPNMPAYDALPDDQRLALDATVGVLVDTTATVAPDLTPEVPNIQANLSEAITHALEPMRVPNDYATRAHGALSSSDVGRFLRNTANSFAAETQNIAGLRKFADSFNLSREVRYIDVYWLFEELFHNSYDLSALVQVQHLVTLLMLRVLRESPGNGGTELCVRIAGFFARYLTTRNMLGFVAKLLRDAVRSASQAQLAALVPIGAQSPLAVFTAGVVAGSVASGVVFLLVVVLTRSRSSS